MGKLKLIHRDISSAFFFLIVDLRERGTLLQQTTQLTHLFFSKNFKCTSALVIFEEMDRKKSSAKNRKYSSTFHNVFVVY